MLPWGVIDEQDCNLVKDVIRDPLIIILLLLTLGLTTQVRIFFFPSTTGIIDLIILFEDCWIILFALKYSFKILIEFYIGIRNNIKKAKAITIS